MLNTEISNYLTFQISPHKVNAHTNKALDLSLRFNHDIAAMLHEKYYCINDTRLDKVVYAKMLSLVCPVTRIKLWSA